MQLYIHPKYGLLHNEGLNHICTCAIIFNMGPDIETVMYIES